MSRSTKTTHKVQTDHRVVQKRIRHCENKALQTCPSGFIETTKNRSHQIGKPCLQERRRRYSPTRNVAVQENLPEFNRELMDIQFSRWWGWNWMRQQERKNSMFPKRSHNVQYPSDYYIEHPRTEIEYFKNSKIHKFFKFMKDIYSATKKKIEKTLESRPKRNVRVMHKTTSYYDITNRVPLQENLHPHYFHTKHNNSCQNSISSLFVQTESRQKKYKRRKRSLQSWIVEKKSEISNSSDDEEEERILTCMSLQTSTGSDYLPPRMKHIYHEADKRKPQQTMVFVKNKRVQTVEFGEESPKLCDKNVGNPKIVKEILETIDAATDTPNFTEKPKCAGLIDKECFASPLTGHLYKINIPELSPPEITYPASSFYNMFDFIEETDLQASNENSDKNHEKLLNSIYEALLSSREQPIMTHYYDDISFNISKDRVAQNLESGPTTRKLYEASEMQPSTKSCSNASDDQNTWERQDIKMKRKSPFRFNFEEQTPSKSYKKSPARDLKRPLLKKKSFRTTFSSISNVNPVIFEDYVTAKQFTNPFLYDNSSACEINEVDAKLIRDIELESMNLPEERYFNEESEVSVEYQHVPEKDIVCSQDSTDFNENSSMSSSCWQRRKSNIPIPVNKNTPNKKRKLS